MANHHPYSLRLTPVALACLLAPAAMAQASGPAELPEVTVRGQAPTSRAAVSGFGDLPLAKSPFQARVVPLDDLKDRGLTRLSDLTLLDASVSDSYNSQGYWDYLSVRGFTLDNKYNYRRDGLPISAETSIPLDNKASVELLKGTSGIQAGTSAPGGLVNHVVKRPQGRVRSLEIGYESPGTFGLAADVGERFGSEQRFGLRINAAYQHLDPHLRDAEGHRRLLAVAGDWQLTPDTVLEAEVELSKRSQPSQPGFSLLGDRLPRPVNPRINLNNQSWTQPVVMEGATGSLRLQHRLNADWKLTAHYGFQHLETDDRLAFPYGVYDADYNCNPCDRYAEDGSFTVWEFVSDNERRRTRSANVFADGRFSTGPLRHTARAGVLVSRHKVRGPVQVNDIAGTGTVDGRTQVPRSAGGPDQFTDRTERSTEFYLNDAIELAPRWTAWLGLRHTRLDRESVRTDGSRPTDYDQSFTTPWAALSYEFAPQHHAYASWGRGVESEVTPNRSDRYTNAGEALKPLKSRQVELGVKANAGRIDWGVSLFDIDRPIAGCSADSPCTWRFDGTARHRGLEGNFGMQWERWRFDASAMFLDAERRGSLDTSLRGKRPVNVPERTLKAQARYRVPQWEGLSLLAALVHESNREVLPDNSIHIPSWTRYDVGLVQENKWQGSTLRWRAGVQNVTDKRAWRESPNQFGHVYLYPMAPRTFFVSLQTDLQ
ncbi:TonB-dependent siderophore receptor [Eleftheria terrae]|uniref:TonB-dependent siderophore receptor n=1 Tax=Eleftheria terrae TaxID=1597781 RepID=UPI00263B6B17|nr:TonB-dependent siderophore receptor [Eleftheria terrae]WKB53843.1 TonB-dependent siderophore receptor [Eleftheria terrae]